MASHRFRPFNRISPLVTKPTGGSFYLATSEGVAVSPFSLLAHESYDVVVTGTVSDWNDKLNGAPEPDAMYPSAPAGVRRKSTQVGLDADTEFARPSYGSGTPPQHWAQLEFDTGSGPRHVEPHGGPYSKPQPEHRYVYTLVGEGHPLRVIWADTPTTDNYGSFLVVVEPL